jgi:hypothetical protein
LKVSPSRCHAIARAIARAGREIAISKTADLRFSIFYILVEILPGFFFGMFMMFPTFDHLMLRVKP